ncbi:hypothetical protein D2T31_21820 [Sinirhodobacter populi]|uniref:Uncharacterized protein n=1 Tax=Paenirhodobacter populi TaxID=2306993 RepID=A0A443JYC0_9RHOB|nr:hypothetical protein D2T31_21820 [Sinirhodobacter populi]
MRAPNRRTAEPPNRRTAEPPTPSGLIAEPPGRARESDGSRGMDCPIQERGRLAAEMPCSCPGQAPNGSGRVKAG